MNKVIIVVLVAVLIGGVWGIKQIYSPMEKKSVVVAEKASSVKVVDGVVMVNVGQKLSMVDLKIKAIAGDTGKFETNKSLFNSELLNQVEEDGRTHIVLGIMKATAELPNGEVVVGKLVDADKVEFEISGTVTVPGEGSNLPKEIIVGTTGVLEK